MRTLAFLIAGLIVVPLCFAQEPNRPNPPTEIGVMPRKAGEGLPAAPPEADRRVLPINLATALGLAGSNAIDIALAAERVQAGVATLELARAYWLPTVTMGPAYDRHDGAHQNADGTVTNTDFGSLMFGAGTGIGSQASILSFDKAIFDPLAARQEVNADRATLQAAANDTMLAVTNAYFGVEQARGELAAALDATRRAEEVLRRVRKLAEGLVPPLEAIRAEAEAARLESLELQARERWLLVSADLVRVLRLDASAQVMPVEPPDLQIALIDRDQSVDELVLIGLANRPELAAQRATIEAALVRVRQEKYRPFIPTLWIRGWSTGASGTLLGGVFGGGPNGSLSNFSARGDIDAQLLWQLDNLGFGNRAKVHQRQSEYRTANLQLQRTLDRVAAEVTQAYDQATLAARRIAVTERAVKLALESYEKNLIGLGQTKRGGELVVMVIRPQEVLAAVQVLARAYIDYYAAVADSNRAQFRLYRAVGNPAQGLADCLPSP
jgi:outer membrane protein TolC